MKRLLFGALTAGALALCAATPSFAQNNANQNQASLRLVIVDDTGAGIPMADVTITSKTAGVKPVSYKSDEKGLAISPGLTPGDVVVHVFDVDQRDFYRLEELWSDAVTVLAIQ